MQHDSEQMQVEIVVKWSGSEFALLLEPTQTVADVKRKLQELTRVMPKKQKLLGLKSKGRPASDDVCIIYI